jgi:ABC-2 type transport system permease protein
MQTLETLERARPRRVALGWAFIERQGNLWKRYWGWELAWIVYGVVNTLGITFIAKQAGQEGLVSKKSVDQLTLFLLIGTLV